MSTACVTLYFATPVQISNASCCIRSLVSVVNRCLLITLTSQLQSEDSRPGDGSAAQLLFLSGPSSFCLRDMSSFVASSIAMEGKRECRVDLEEVLWPGPNTFPHPSLAAREAGKCPEGREAAPAQASASHLPSRLGDAPGQWPHASGLIRNSVPSHFPRGES